METTWPHSSIRSTISLIVNEKSGLAWSTVRTRLVVVGFNERPLP